MGRRPMCLICLLLMSAMCLGDLLGIPLIRGNPLPESLRTWIAGHPEAVICGEVQQCAEIENSHSIYLKQVYLLYQDDEAQNSEKDSYKKVSIENVRVFLKKEKNDAAENIPAGTLLKVSGRLVRVPETRNPGEFDSRQYYACRHIYYFMKDGVIEQKSDSYSKYLQGLLDVRECFADIFRRTAGEDAPVFEAMVLGEKSELEDETKLRYQMAGIIHILAISGMHISLLGAGLNKILKKTGIGIFLSGMISLAVMLQYGMLTGGSVAAMRAVCMFLLAVGAELLGRCYDGMTALALSAVILILSAPANLYSSGFLLSFGAVAGLGTASVFCCPANVKKHPAKVWPGWLAGTKKRMENALISSVFVQLMTLPVMLYFYGEVSVAGIVLNLAVLPTVGAVLACGVCGGLLGLVSLPLAKMILLPGRGLLFLYEKGCEAAAGIPWCTWVGGQPELWQIGVYYGLLGVAVLIGKWEVDRRRKEALKNSGRNSAIDGKGQNRKAMLCCCGLILAGILILGWRPGKGLTITCLDVGQGDGIVLETSQGYHFLIDGGSSNQSSVGRYQILPYLKSRGISRLDAVFVSHTDEDHISGIRELLTLMGEHLTAIRVDKLILPGWENENEAYAELEQLAAKAGVAVVKGNSGDVMRAGEMVMRLLSPDSGSLGSDVNEEGMVIEVEYGDFRGLFTGDIGVETEKKLLPVLEDVDFLKAAHHGSRYSTGEEFLEKVRPEVAVVSCSSVNTYGHPSAETVERLEDCGCQVEYTMNSGAVAYWTDGKSYCVRRWIEEGGM